MRHISRRDFLKTGALAAGLTIVPNSVLGKTHGFTSPSDKLNIAGVGVGGMGRGNLRNMSTENIVALCDVDWRYAEKTFNDYPKAKNLKIGVLCSMSSENQLMRYWLLLQTIHMQELLLMLLH